jgi:hypothetical protein
MDPDPESGAFLPGIRDAYPGSATLSLTLSCSDVDPAVRARCQRSESSHPSGSGQGEFHRHIFYQVGELTVFCCHPFKNRNL